LPRIHRRRDAGVDGPGLRAAAATGLSRRDRAHRELATVAVRRRAAAAHPGTDVVRRLRRAAQGCRRRADAAHDAGSSRHGTDGLRRPAGDRRRHPVRVGRARQRDRREARPMIRVLALVACLLTVCITASSAFIRHWQNGVGCEGWPVCYRAAQPPAQVPSTAAADGQGALDAAVATIARVPAGDAPGPVRAARALHRVTATLAGVLVLLVVAFGWSTMGGGERIAAAVALVDTVFLSWLGRYTPHDLPLVTLGNLIGGLLLAAALAWIAAARRGRKRAAPPGAHGQGADGQGADGQGGARRGDLAGDAARGVRPFAIAALVLLALIAWGGTMIGERHAIDACSTPTCASGAAFDIAALDPMQAT